MFVIVEYLETGIVKTINLNEKVMSQSYAPKSSTSLLNCWKTSKNASKNWMRHPSRILNTGGARTLNERGMCRHSLFLLPGD